MFKIISCLESFPVVVILRNDVGTEIKWKCRFPEEENSNEWDKFESFMLECSDEAIAEITIYSIEYQKFLQSRK